MTAALWAVASGVGFGLFQSLNRRALVDIEDPYVSTFLNLAIAAAALLAVALATEDVGRLLDADPWTLVAFAGAGIVHFLLGWTFLNLSQRRIGAARTSPLLTMSPVFALAIAAIAVGQFPSPVALVAIAPMVARRVPGGGRRARGARRRRAARARVRADVGPQPRAHARGAGRARLAAARRDARDGRVGGRLRAVPARPRPAPGAAAIAPGALAFKVAAGLLVAFATWWRWLAIDGTDVAVVLALALVSVPIVLFLSPLLVGRHLERVTRTVWLGAGLVVGGALTLIAVA